mmetsp:Transcript_41686/g.73182  ORF Transcript_41686/g.73182 Transcript_41686/m.73182 type:complete len:254 (+) Transcript_41686:1589-2350(+)
MTTAACLDRAINPTMAEQADADPMYASPLAGAAVWAIVQARVARVAFVARASTSVRIASTVSVAIVRTLLRPHGAGEALQSLAQMRGLDLRFRTDRPCDNLLHLRCLFAIDALKARVTMALSFLAIPVTGAVIQAAAELASHAVELRIAHAAAVQASAAPSAVVWTWLHFAELARPPSCALASTLDAHAMAAAALLTSALRQVIDVRYHCWQSCRRNCGCGWRTLGCSKQVLRDVPRIAGASSDSCGRQRPQW